MTIPGIFVDASANFQVNDVELRLLLTSQTQLQAAAINNKETALYPGEEIFTSQIYYDPNNLQNQLYVIRKVFSTGAIAAGATTTIAHSITGITQCVHVYGAVVTDVVDFRPLPYASVTANANIELKVDATQITIANGAASPNITSGTVVLEYLKQ